jgi:hypothetical protein
MALSTTTAEARAGSAKKKRLTGLVSVSHRRFLYRLNTKPNKHYSAYDMALSTTMAEARAEAQKKPIGVSADGFY